VFEKSAAEIFEIRFTGISQVERQPFHVAAVLGTDAGLLAFGIEAVVASAVTALRKARLGADPQPTAADTPKLVNIRAGTKQTRINALLQRSEGASIAEIMAETGWLAQ